MILWQDIYSKIAYLFTGILITQLALYIWLLDYHNISIIEEPQAFIENEAGHKLKKKKNWISKWIFSLGKTMALKLMQPLCCSNISENFWVNATKYSSYISETFRGKYPGYLTLSQEGTQTCNGLV